MVLENPIGWSCRVIKPKYKFNPIIGMGWGGLGDDEVGWIGMGWIEMRWDGLVTMVAIAVQVDLQPVEEASVAPFCFVLFLITIRSNDLFLFLFFN